MVQGTLNLLTFFRKKGTIDKLNYQEANKEEVLWIISN